MKRVFSQGKWRTRSPEAAHYRLSTAARLVMAIFVLLTAFALAPVAYAQEGVHVVARGESLASIANQYGVSVQTLSNTNGLSDPNFIYTGQRLVIPGNAVTDSALTDNALTDSTLTDNAVATSAVAATSQLPSGDGYYTVARGDTLSAIAANNGMTMADLMRLNGLSNGNFVWVGQKLRVSARVDVVQSDKAPEPQLADSIYVVKVGDTISGIAQANGTTPQALLVENGLPNANFVWVGQRLRIGSSSTSTIATSSEVAPADGKRWIEVNLSTQTLIAWQGDAQVMHTNISSGVKASPTVTGRFYINSKLASQRMYGPGYDLPNVPWVMYFFSNYAIHGAYWHNNFGTPMSHGCVNMRVDESGTLYKWASIGTEVYVHY